MPSVNATVHVLLPPAVVYRYLRERYDRPVFLAACLASKGYVPAIVCRRAEESQYLSFSVQARFSPADSSHGGWQWEYDLEPAGQGATKVIITYRWSWVMSVLSSWTIRLQACNEIVETAMALDALTWTQTLAGEELPKPAVQTSDAIRPTQDQHLTLPGEGGR